MKIFTIVTGTASILSFICLLIPNFLEQVKKMDWSKVGLFLIFVFSTLYIVVIGIRTLKDLTMRVENLERNQNKITDRDLKKEADVEMERQMEKRKKFIKWLFTGK